MASKQFKTYCKITDYVEHVDPELAAILRGTCAVLPLESLKGKPGVTFLMPQDKAFRAKLEKLAYSDKTEDATMAADMLNALIIRDVIKNPTDWKAKEIANSLYPSQVVEVDSVSTKEVVFKSGAKAVLDTNFKDASRRNNLAVWKLISGEIPVTTDKPAQTKFNKHKAKTGSYDPGRLHTQSERFKIAIAVENAYALCRLSHDSGAAGHANRDVYLEHSLSLINYILTVRQDTALLYERVLPLISLDKLDFYLLVEPHCSTGNYLLDDTLIHEWWTHRNNHTVCPAKVIQDIEKLLMNGTGALVYTNRAKILETTANVRQKLMQSADARPRNIVDEISKFYDDLSANNTIDGVGPIFPQQLAQYYASAPGLKLIQDELRYLTYGAFKSLESRAFDYGAFHELINMIGECLHAPNEADRAKMHKLLNKNTIKYLISPSENIQEIKIFIYSTMFLFIPMTHMEAAALKQKHSITRPDPAGIVVFNISKDLYLQHQRLVSTDHNANADIIAALKSIDVSTLEPALRDELKRKFSS